MIYVASPYTSESCVVRQDRYEAVCAFCAQMALEGNYVFSPIAHWHPIATTYDLSTDAYWWREFNKDYLINSTDLWVLELAGWRESRGIKREIAFAAENKIKISYFKKEGGEFLCIK